MPSPANAEHDAGTGGAMHGAAPAPPQHPHGPLIEELHRRIHELQHHEEHAFGGFSALDWWICTLGAVALPVIALLYFWP
jgi:hypothetical protein